MMKNLVEYYAKPIEITGGGNSQQNVSKPLFDEGSRIPLLYPCYTLALTLRRGSSALARLLRVSCATLALLLVAPQINAAYYLMQKSSNNNNDKGTVLGTMIERGDGIYYYSVNLTATNNTAYFYVTEDTGDVCVNVDYLCGNFTINDTFGKVWRYEGSCSNRGSDCPKITLDQTGAYCFEFRSSDTNFRCIKPNNSGYYLMHNTASGSKGSSVGEMSYDGAAGGFRQDWTTTLHNSAVHYFYVTTNTASTANSSCDYLNNEDGKRLTAGGGWRKLYLYGSSNYDHMQEVALSSESAGTYSFYFKKESDGWIKYTFTAQSLTFGTTTGSVTVNNSIDITVNTVGISDGTTVTFKVGGSSIGTATVSSNSATLSYTPSATGSQTITASVTLNGTEIASDNSYSLTVNAAGVPTHNVTVYYKCGGSDIQASTTASSVPESGTGSTVTAPAINGYTFSSWTLGSGVTGSFATNSITINTTSGGSGYTLTANYTQDNYTITLSAGAGGSVTAATSLTDKHYGDNITITAVPDAGKRFKQWTVTSGTATIASTTTASTTLTVTGNATVRADFESEYYIGGTHLHYDDNWSSNHDAMEYNGSYYYCQMTYVQSVSNNWSGGFVQFKIFAHPSEQQYPLGTSGYFGTLKDPQGTVALELDGQNVKVTGSNGWSDGTQFYICFDPSSGIWAQTADPTSTTPSITFSPASGIGIKNTNTSVTVTTANIADGTTVTFTMTNSSSTDVTPAARTATVSSNSATWNFTAPATAGTYTITASATIEGTAYTSNTYTLTVYDQLYAFIQGRFHVYNKSTSSWTNTFSFGDWDVNSTAIQMSYDSENNRFYLRTYATPQELSNQISSIDPYFFIKTSTSSSSLENVTTYWSATSTTLSDAGYANRKTLVHTGSVQDANLKFNSSATAQNVVLYFDGSSVWYELEAKSVDITAIGLSATRIPPMATVTAMPTIDARGASGNKAYCWQLFSDEGCTTEVTTSFTSLGDGRVSFPAPVTQRTYYLRLQVHSNDGCASSLDDEEVVSFTVTTSEMVFFRNVPNWGSVHVYFLGTEAYWDGSKGSGCAGRDNGDAHGMTRIPNTNIYYYDYHGNSNVVFNASGAAYIAFTDNYKPNANNFSGCQAVYRGDFSTCAPMYVPENYITDYKNTSALDGQAAYYNRGYWTNYMSTASGFTLHVYDGITGTPAQVFAQELTGTAGDYTYRYTYNFSSSGKSTPWIYGFKVEGCGGSWYGAGNTMTVDNCTNWNLFTGTDNCGLTVNANMKHTFVLTLTGDGHVQMSVEYPMSVGDYRLIYDDDTQNPHPSQYIRKRANGKDTVAMFVRSLHNPALKVQYCSAIEGETVMWSDYAWNSGSAAVSYTGSMGTDTAGVYLFYLEQDESGNLTVNTAETKPYVGLYYIRTNSVNGGWASYKTTPDNRMTYAAYPLEQGYGFDYYKAKWVPSAGSKVTFTIACDYSEALSDTLYDDEVIGNKAEDLPQEANVRFGWNSRTNRLTRAYISGSTTISDRFLVLTGDAKMKNTDGTALAIAGLNPNELNFTDLGNWIYRADIMADPGAAVRLTAKYNGATQYFIGTAETSQQIIGGTTGDARTLRVTYDFKINRLMTAWLPDGNEITDKITLKADMMLIRKGQEAATQITFGEKEGKKGEIDEIKSVYGVMEFRKQDIAGQFPNWSAEHAYEFLMYYISFPFDVRVHDIFGAGTMGENWIIQKYNGAKRAQIGWFAETSTFWETLPADSTLHAYEGYLLLLDRVSFNDPTHALWAYIPASGSIYLYFPSATNSIGTISDATKTITVPSHVCGINRTFTPVGESFVVNHKYTDSHWNVIGTPLFATTNASTVGTPVADGAEGTTLQYYYEWNYSNNTLSVAAAPDAAATFTTSSPSFKSMHGYMVQYAGDVTFRGAAINNTVSPAPRRVREKSNYRVELHAVHEDGTVSPTFVELRENACDTFALNEDMYMMRSSRTADLYSFAGSYDVAANVLSLDNHTVPLGLDVKQAGTYRFTMPSDFTGTVTLLDKTTGTRTNLALGDYEVYLDRGAVNNRFELILSVSQITTSVGTVGGDGNGNVRKFLHNGQLYILREGVVYDARGARVQ